MMAKFDETKMDSKAGNDGDQLKHPLCLEVIENCSKWARVTYAETHAGAGRYLSSKQGADRPYISKLKSKVMGVPEDAPRSMAGCRYLGLLRNWWELPEVEVTYPGSVLQVATTLDQLLPRSSWEVRVTESHKATYDRLKDSLGRYGIEPRHDGFQNQIQWLTENDNLVLRVDPYGFTPTGHLDEAKREKATLLTVSNGNIDLHALEDVFKPCWHKERAVVVFWCSFAHSPGAEAKKLVKAWIEEEVSARGARFRWFYRSHYNIAIVGIGDGGAVVDGLPRSADWQRSWMAGFISEE
jgi:hypothetical protein